MEELSYYARGLVQRRHEHTTPHLLYSRFCTGSTTWAGPTMDHNASAHHHGMIPQQREDVKSRGNV